MGEKKSSAPLLPPYSHVPDLRRWSRVTRALTFMAVGFLAACGTIQSMMPEHKAAEAHAAQMQELQLRVMRYADEYVGRIIGPLNEFQSQPHTTADERLAAQNWKVQQSTSAYTVASGPNPLTNALDMVVLATLSRMVMEDSWVK